MGLPGIAVQQPSCCYAYGIFRRHSTSDFLVIERIARHDEQAVSIGELDFRRNGSENRRIHWQHLKLIRPHRPADFLFGGKLGVSPHGVTPLGGGVALTRWLST